jgi:hypothetical protein
MNKASSNLANEKQTFSEFLESAAPGTTAKIADLYIQERSLLAGGLVWGPATPDIQLYCGSPSCGGLRFFIGKKDVLSSTERFFLVYTCRNCNQTTKTFAVLASQQGATPEGTAQKLGENPPFGPPTPARVISLIGPDRELFIRGRRAETQGLGIGAFAYYRRVVENQKFRIIGEMGKVAERLGAEPEMVRLFEKAKTEERFSKAIDDIKDAIPRALLVRNHNPLKLLHGALSQGLHAQTDEECLEIATSIRVVLTELAERISNALKDENELEQAVNKLLQSRKLP